MKVVMDTNSIRCHVAFQGVFLLLGTMRFFNWWWLNPGWLR